MFAIKITAETAPIVRALYVGEVYDKDGLVPDEIEWENYTEIYYVFWAEPIRYQLWSEERLKWYLERNPDKQIKFLSLTTEL